LLELLEFLSREGPCSLGVIARGLGLNKTTAHRFASTLVKTGYAIQGPDRSYALTTRVVELASHVLGRLELRATVRPVLDALAHLARETVHLGVLEGHEVVYIDKIDGAQPVRMASYIGARGTLHSTALGKVLLADRPEVEWTQYADRGLIGRTPRTITTVEELAAHLRRVRQQGYAIDDIENEEGIRCMGAPIRNHVGRVAAAVSISGWTVSMTDQRVRELLPTLIQHADRASRLLGYPAAAALAPAVASGA
jgi:IclR family acetate operon transcriptional repressor